MIPLTPRQQDIYDFIVTYIQSNGFPPTLRQISHRFGMASPVGAMYSTNVMVKKGWLKKHIAGRKSMVPTMPPIRIKVNNDGTTTIVGYGTVTIPTRAMIQALNDGEFTGDCLPEKW